MCEHINIELDELESEAIFTAVSVAADALPAITSNLSTKARFAVTELRLNNGSPLDMSDYETMYHSLLICVNILDDKIAIGSGLKEMLAPYSLVLTSLRSVFEHYFNFAS